MTDYDIGAKKAGYTHKVSWSEYNDWINMYVPRHFYTTDDAVDLHVRTLNKLVANGKKIIDICSEKLV